MQTWENSVSNHIRQHERMRYTLKLKARSLEFLFHNTIYLSPHLIGNVIHPITGYSFSEEHRLVNDHVVASNDVSYLIGMQAAKLLKAA